jgi:hypothetical protein
MSSMGDRFVVGTANFGKQYGTIRPYALNRMEIIEISNFMEKTGLDKVDTAFSYAPNKSYSKLDQSFFIKRKVTTKVSLKNLTDASSNKSIRDYFVQDLNTKRIQKYNNILFHDSEDLKSRDGLMLLEVISQLKEEGLADGVGVSVYTAKEIDDVFKIMNPDVVQVPVNPFDQRLLISGHLAELAHRKIKIQVRSIFLQGLLFQREFGLGSRAYFARNYLEKWWKFLIEENIDPLTLCLSFILTNDLFDEVVIGVNSVYELQDIVYTQTLEQPLDFSYFALADENILDPRKWAK